MSLRPLLTIIDPRNARGPHETCPSKIGAYVSAMERGDKFPPARVVDYGGIFMIVDGHHRAAAANRVGLPLEALVARGDAFEALDAKVSQLGKRADDLEFWQ